MGATRGQDRISLLSQDDSTLEENALHQGTTNIAIRQPINITKNALTAFVLIN